MSTRLTWRESVVHIVGCVFIGLLTVGVSYLLLWVAVHGGAALAAFRHSAMFPFGFVGFLFSLVALGSIVIGLIITMRDWQGIFLDIIASRRGGVL